MSEHCFWILTDGRIVKPDSRHILAVVSAPEIFGETAKSIQETFERHGESMNSNFEGKARQVVLLRVINKNHIRIRKNQYARCQHWSIQLFEMTDERKSAISRWAKYVSALTVDRYADAIIHQFHDGSKFRTSLNVLADQCPDTEEPIILRQTGLLVSANPHS